SISEARVHDERAAARPIEAVRRVRHDAEHGGRLPHVALLVAVDPDREDLAGLLLEEALAEPALRPSDGGDCVVAHLARTIADDDEGRRDRARVAAAGAVHRAPPRVLELRRRERPLRRAELAARGEEQAAERALHFAAANTRTNDRSPVRSIVALS